MIIKNTGERNCIFLSVFAFLFHLISIKFYPINFEFSFSEGAKFFQDFEIKLIDEYFFNQANTFVFPLIVGLIDKILFIDDTLVTARILSASSYLFFGFGFITIFRFYKIKLSCAFFILYFFLNPLIWTFGHRGIPDLFATSIAFYSFSIILIIKNISSFKSYLSFALLGISICIKPFCLIYLGLIFLLKYNKNLFFIIKKYFAPFFISLLLPIIYFSLIKINYGFYLIPDKFSNEVSFLKGGFFNNFFGYFIILSLFILPLSFKKKFINLKNFLIVIFILFPLSFVLGNIINSPQAELNFGFLNNLVGNKPIFLIGAISLLIFCLYVYDYLKVNYPSKNRANIDFLIIVFIYIFILSLTRPSQRYLIIILPLIMIFFLTNSNYLKNKMIFIPVVILYICFNIILFVNFYLNSSINENIVKYLLEKDILKKTLPGPLYPHSYHYFHSEEDKSYVITTDPKNHIKKFEKNIFILEKKFYLKKI